MEKPTHRPISVIIPVFNEETGIGEVVRRCRKFASEVIVVDGGSKDRTVAIAIEAGARVIIDGRRGYGLALLLGIDEAEGPIIATCDGDGTYPVELIPHMASLLESSTIIRFVSGCRFPLLNKRSMKLTNIIGNKALSIVGSVLFGRRFKDILSGMWVFQKSCLDELNLYSRKWDLSQEIKIEADRHFQEGLFEFHIPYEERRGESKLFPWTVGWENLRYFFIQRLGLRALFQPRFLFAAERKHSDNWDTHWGNFSRASEAGPSTGFRCRLIHKLITKGGGLGPAVVEIGCGTGQLGAYLAHRSVTSYTGFDTSETAIEKCKPRFLSRYLHITSIPSIPQSLWSGMETVICSEVLEHVDYPGSLLATIGAKMESGARLIITVPAGPMNEFYHRIGHRRHYTPEEMVDVVKWTGMFEIEQAFGYGWPFFNLYRIMLTLAGQKAISSSFDEPTFAVRLAGRIFSALMRVSLRFGWQTVVVAVKK